MHRVKSVAVTDDHSLYVEFENGVSGEIDLSDQLFGPVFEPLKDPEYFKRVSIDEFGVICWPNGADLAPDALYKQISKEHTPQSA